MCFSFTFYIKQSVLFFSLIIACHFFSFHSNLTDRIFLTVLSHMPCITQQTDPLFRFGTHRHFLLLSIPMIQICKTSFLHSRDLINIFHRDLVSLFQDQQMLRLVHSFYMPRDCHICAAILFFIGYEKGHRDFRVNLFFFQYQLHFLIQLLFFILIQLDPLFCDPFRLL